MHISTKASKSISAMVEAKDIINHLIMEAGYRSDQFDWNVHIYPFTISLYDDGFEFATGDMDQFENPAEFMRWVMSALSMYYYGTDQEEE